MPKSKGNKEKANSIRKEKSIQSKYLYYNRVTKEDLKTS